MNLENIDLDQTREETKEICIKEYNHSFEFVKENITIANPRNFFLKNIFSDIFKDLMFKNKSFINIKKIYATKYGKKSGFKLESKQIDYPTRQKNYSNFLEPKIFLRRDFNFFDKIYFPISFVYLPKSFINNKIQDIYFYKHQFKYKKEKITQEMTHVCELVTNQYLYFGKIYLFNKFLIFEREVDPRNTNERDLDIFIKYSISTKSKETKPNENNKFVIIFFDIIQEAIKRRTLLITQSLEIFLKNGKSFFFNFFKTEEAQKVYDYFNEKKEEYNLSFDINNNQKDIKNLLSNYHEGKISNYYYLLYLNKYSTRSYSDLSQYQVFPWLILDRKQIINISENNEDIIRDMKYPVSMQNEEQREECIKKYIKDKEEKNFCTHFDNHYSSAAYVYYYLMRLNPYGQDLIKLQNYHNENPNRIFSSFENLEHILSSGIDNRELIPDFFCYFDFLLNLNCSFFGETSQDSINDDFKMNFKELFDDSNIISPFVYNLYIDKKLLNSIFVTKKLPFWVDIIFGKNQLLENETEAANSCNIFIKVSYEQKFNLEKKFEKYIKLIEENKIKEKQFFDKMRGKIAMAVNFGMTPKKILNTTNICEVENKNINIFEIKKVFEEKLICYERISNEKYLLMKDIIKKDKSKIRIIGIYKIKSKNLSERKTLEYKHLNLLKKYKYLEIDYQNKTKKIPLYNPSYSISHIDLKTDKKNNLIILTCRYLGNYFNIQTKEKNINVYCEDFVTCIKVNNLNDKNIFYTGLFNGKLTEWEIGTNFEINDIKSIYSHQESITVIELFIKQNVIVTASEDKYIHIRKIFDFELLTAINLTYCFSNPIISKNNNIFPSIIKISDLNLLYVLIYDLDSKTNFIRGYNLNGLFFAQTEEEFFKDEKNKNIIINSLSFTKNSNLIVGFYNLNKFYSLQS